MKKSATTSSAKQPRANNLSTDQQSATQRKKSKSRTKQKINLRIPRKTMIAGRPIGIFLDAEIEEYGHDGSYYENSICLNANIHGRHREEVYIHELVEAVNALYELKLPHRIITVLGMNLHQALISGEGEVT